MPKFSPIFILYQSNNAFAMHAAFGRRNLTPSHLCWRTATPADFEELAANAEALGKRYDRPHDGKRIVWIALNNPLRDAQGHAISHLEITEPRAEDIKTRPAMLVFANPKLTPKEGRKFPSPLDPDFTLRFQERSAAAILALPTP